jgi:endonuclease YncB( thermonuclease family)
MCGMPMLCLAGAFTVTGTEPDGDSLRFRPDDPDDWTQVPGSHKVRTNAAGAAQLRIDAIDALETHYTPTGGHLLHQPLDLAHAAAAELLKWLGFRGVQRDGEKVIAVDQDDRPGFILTRGADVYGRCVALVGRGDPPATSGGMINVDVKLVRKTANHRLLSTGLAYPTFYSKLYVDLRRELAKQSGAARDAGKGVFARDRTQKGVEVKTLTTLTDDAVILPKLFRRLTDYLHLNGDDPSLAGFMTFLSQQDDQLWVIPTGQKTNLDTVVAVSGQTVRLKRLPEELVFEEK